MFQQAKPIWLQDAKKDYNNLFGFILNFESAEGLCALNVTAADCYQVYLNGEFLLAGPARSASGFFRLDKLNFKAKKGLNSLVFLVAEYNVNCYEYAQNDGFLQAEVIENGCVLAFTDKDTQIFEVTERVKKAQRYSFQRTFSETWNIGESYKDMLCGKKVDKTLCAQELENKNILPRKSNVPKFANIKSKIISGGTMLSGVDFSDDKRKVDFVNSRFFKPVEIFKTYDNKDVEVKLASEVCGMETLTLNDKTTANIRGGEFRIFDFTVNACGFIDLKVKVEKDSTVYILFDEILTDSDVCFYRLDCLNCVKYNFKAGEHHAISLEPYVFRYAKIYCDSGCVEVTDFSLKEVAHADVDKVNFKSKNKKLEHIFNAALNTFKYNAVDILMDCPSRERAGWLCDGFFTGRAEKVLTGENKVEHDFLENFLLQEKFEFLPEGIVPMCFPASHNDRIYIPTWAMWFILELDRYYKDSADKVLVERAEKTVRGIITFFDRFVNETGLLENLESWVFIEWSKAAEFVNGVNYCANMLFALTLQRAGEMYNDENYLLRAEKMRKVIRERSFNGKFFSDHALRNDKGELSYVNDITEVCQYYAFFTKTATPETYPELWETLLTEFGPNRKTNNKYPEIWFANAFIGNYLRLELLNEQGLKEQLLNECLDYFAYMADLTNTLWEHDSTFASCNHGFASYVINWINEYNEN